MDALDDYMIAAIGQLEMRRKEIDEAILAIKKILAQTNENFAKEIRDQIPWANPGKRRVKFFCRACDREVYVPAMTKTCPACGERKLKRQ